MDRVLDAWATVILGCGMARQDAAQDRREMIVAPPAQRLLRAALGAAGAGWLVTGGWPARRRGEAAALGVRVVGVLRQVSIAAT